MYILVKLFVAQMKIAKKVAQKCDFYYMLGVTKNLILWFIEAYEPGT